LRVLLERVAFGLVSVAAYREFPVGKTKNGKGIFSCDRVDLETSHHAEEEDAGHRNIENNLEIARDLRRA
jgi:hypothetical protein